MNCPDFQERIAERVAGELSAEQRQEMDAHEKNCPSCQRSVAEWREMQSLLLASWPTENPPRPFFLPNLPQRSTWFETARTWFAFASMAAVTGCLLMLAILRPAVNFDHRQLSINFAHSRTGEEAISAQTVTQAQVQAWVRQALEQPTPQGAEKMQPASGSRALPSSEEQARRLTQLGVEFEILKENQASLWQQVEQHGLYLQSAWRSPADPSDSKEKPNFNRQ